MVKPGGALLALVAVLGLGCTEDRVPDSGFLDPNRDAGLAAVAEVGVADAEPPLADATILHHDVGLVVIHDAGAPARCENTCDCAQGLGCIDGLCKTAGVGPVYCCDNPGCPQGRACLNAREQPGVCPMPPDAGPDAGPRDVGGAVGAACMTDEECDDQQMLQCLTQADIAIFWGGYCSRNGCVGGCPSMSMCVAFGPNPTDPRACLANCTVDADCRDDAYCFNLGANQSVCLPNCRDDLFDCAPRTGVTYCDRMSGKCEPTPMQSATGAVGGACTDNRDCGSGQVCMGEFAWGFTSGLCTQICTGLPEASPCGPGTTCHQFAGIGMCFRNCDSGMQCPDRPGATCLSLDQAWSEPGCIEF